MTAKAVCKLAVILIVVSFFVALSLVANFVFFFSKSRKIKATSCLVKHTSALFLSVLNIKPSFFGSATYIPQKGKLIVANHTSYIDIFILSTKFNSVFVSNTDIKSSFGFFILTELSNSIFVNRKNHSNIKTEVKEITSLLNNGINVVVFPESTTTNGEKVREFKSPLFQSVIDSEANILPICIRYKSMNGSPINENNRDLIFWYGGMRFFPHFLRLLTAECITVDISALEEIKNGQNLTRKALAEISHNRINNCYRKDCILI